MVDITKAITAAKSITSNHKLTDPKTSNIILIDPRVSKSRVLLPTERTVIPVRVQTTTVSIIDSDDAINTCFKDETPLDCACIIDETPKPDKLEKNALCAAILITQAVSPQIDQILKASLNIDFIVLGRLTRLKNRINKQSTT